MHMSEPLKGSLVQLENLKEKDLHELWDLIYNEDHPEWRKWDSPYLTLQPIEYEKFHDQMLNLIKQGLDKQLVVKVKEKMIGVIFYDWEHESSNSLEIGIAIYHPAYRGDPYVSDAIKTWMDYLFYTFPIPRIGLSTWSGNDRMIKIGKELGMMVEGRIRKSRLYRGKYYDSVKLGILREEWESVQ
ncbi:GNAT family N-acetyltransferase [Mesobacillus maritimus]|uniref:GNAT family N-acetyltransferase n=1 Tax=Mesobacillus maritimus TaxID=1643336 RepID=UPI00384CD570